MRTPRIAILVLFITSSLFIVYRAFTSPKQPSSAAYATPSLASPNDKSVWGLMYYNTPFSLFPPNAAISLTDDNSTSFAARPAAFGSKLAPDGLSGQLWVGSGFPEDVYDGGGELGCSDLLGWDGGTVRTGLEDTFAVTIPQDAIIHGQSHPKRSLDLLDTENQDATVKSKLASQTLIEDGTDDHLHTGPNSPIYRHDSTSSSYADIQSLQETAEIQGKVVLLMRGGCGFLDKVMWAQRRGAVAVIVGDNQRGGPLIQMFAHGEEVDNVTIPSVFTARTTAHLLSTLAQPGSFLEGILDDGGHSRLKVQSNAKPKKITKVDHLSPTLETAHKSSTSKLTKAKRNLEDSDISTVQIDDEVTRGWFSRTFLGRRSTQEADRQSRPPHSVHQDWVLVDEWSDERDQAIKTTIGRGKGGSKSTSDNFVIGVQDWRDPDLVDKSGLRNHKMKPTGKSTDRKLTADTKDSLSGGNVNLEINGPKGGSITPGSGEYNPTKPLDKGHKDVEKSSDLNAGHNAKGHGFMAKLFGDEDEAEPSPLSTPSYNDEDGSPKAPETPEPHAGLWVTITPTSSASPFLDTLLVLVISPLITLTVVYALLIIRARLRRRRWRAPKSVVERLPVRTYHTVAASPSASPRLPSPSSNSPTTPLLQQNQPRPRPRSRTTTGVMESTNMLTPSPAVPTPRASNRHGHRHEHEKGSSGFSAEWKKYMGRQVECVVCLEEYVHGVSKVMSLPCGHEYHVECM